MIRALLIVILVVAFLILSIPILIVEWIIGKFNPYARDISSLRIVQFMFKLILFVAGTKVTVIGEDRIPKDMPVLYVGNHRSYFDIVLTYARQHEKNSASLHLDGTSALFILESFRYQRRSEDHLKRDRSDEKRDFHVYLPGRYTQRVRR